MISLRDSAPLISSGKQERDTRAVKKNLGNEM